MLPVLWSTKAQSDLERLVGYVASDSAGAAEALRTRIEAAIEPASQFPYMFRAGRLSGTREVVAHPNYIIVYRVLATHIQVDAIVHARQQYPPTRPLTR
jgi:toxin ParE1/3/4